MYYVYRFLDSNKKIIYVGKSKQELDQRFRGHQHLPQECYNLCHIIEYIECSTESDMSMKEIYYINKYKTEFNYFNILDVADIPVSIEFDDIWKEYRGPLGPHFCNSVNFLNNYTYEKPIRYKGNGTIDRRRSNKQAGVSTFVEGLTESEVSRIIDYLISEINKAENNNQEQIRFRNLVIFILGINIPHKAGEFLAYKYRDLFDENDNLKEVELRLNRFHKDKIIFVPIKEVAKKTILAYTKKYGLTFNKYADNYIFETREHQIMTQRTWWRILNVAANAVGIDKNVGSETLRKTYGLKVFNTSDDKFGAIVFLSELWGQSRDASILQYLNIVDDIDYSYYLSEKFALGKIELSKINCIQSL